MNIIDIIRDALPIIEKSAPIIASSLGSPFASIALSLLSHGVNTDPKNPKELVKKLFDHDCAEELKKLEQSHGEWLKSLLEVKQPPKNFEMTINVKFPDDR